MSKDMAKFNSSTRRIIGARAGWRCSFPGCGKVTVGPGANPGEFSQTGTAAHIYSRNDNGPRGTGGLSADERKSPENGIWLCPHHGTIVDANRGDKYPPDLLFGYKLEHEARIAAEHEGLPLYRFQDITMHENPVFRPASRIRFGKVTLLVGDNATGKTTTLRWIDQISPFSRLWRDDRHRKTERIHYSVNLRCPTEQTVSVIRDSTQLCFMLNGKAVLLNPIMTEIVFPDRYAYMGMLESFLEARRREVHDSKGKSLDDVSLLAEYMDINSLLIPNLLPYVGSFVENQMENARIEELNGLRKIFIDDKKRISEKRKTSLHSISGSMAARFVMDMQIAMANRMAEVVPTALFLNLVSLHLDPKNLGLYVKLLLSPDIHFQTVFETPHNATLKQELGWSAVLLKGRAPSCTIEQLS